MLKTILFRERPAIYEVAGSGLPVMLVHGFTEDRRIWHPLLEGIKENRRWIIPDLPGSGGSAENILLITLQDFAEYIRAVADAEGLDKFVLIGHSMGGYIALAFAEKYPERLQGLGLFHSSSYPDSQEKQDARDRNIAFILRNGSRAFVETAIPGLFSDRFKESDPDEIQKLVTRYANFSPATLVQYLKAMKERPATTAVLKKTTIPVLFIMGEEDKAVPIKDGLEQCYIPQISYIHVLTHTAHMGMIENTSICRSYVDRFLDSFQR